jgi:hypothetical protein
MVLVRRHFVLLTILLSLATPSAFAQDESSPAKASAIKTMSTSATVNPNAAKLKDAQKTARSGKYDEAIKELESSFDFSSRETPVAVTATACLWSLRTFSHEKAAQTATAAMGAHLPWWPDYLKTKKDETVDVSGYLSKLHKNHLALIGCYGDAKSQLYAENFRKMSVKDRAQLKHEIKKTYDFLIQSDYPSEKSEAFNARVTEADDLAQKKRKKFFIDAQAQYMFYQETFKFTGAANLNGNALIQVLCPGVQLGYRSFFTEYGVGGCIGYGKAKLDFNGFAFEDNSQAIILDFNARAIRKFSDNRIGLGAELNTWLSNIDSASAGGYKSKKISDFRIAPMIVTRIIFDNVTFDIKGGRVIDLPSAIWTVGFTFNLK